ncbi:leucine-rich repeat domain-containing protein [bacterium]|nr:leucine-rich repeat domain-containing protein [bacterium]
MKKLLMSLLLVGGGFVGLVRGAQQMTPAELAIWERQQDQDKVPSLQMLCLKRLLANKTQEEAQEVLKKLPETFYVKSFHAEFSRKMLEFARDEYKKQPLLRSSFLVKYKEANPEIGLLLARGIVSYSLSIQDLIDAGVVVRATNHQTCFYRLDITSLDGLQNIGLPSLRGLYLSHNQIREIVPGVFDNLPALRRLYLSDNQITEIAPGAFKNLPALRDLNLSDNQIREIAPGAFAGLRKLKDLNLRSNNINRLSKKVFSGLKKLNTLNIVGNPGIAQEEVRAQLPESITLVL